MPGSSRIEEARSLLAYRAWADARTLAEIEGLSEAELLRPRATRFGTIPRTLHHVWVVDDIFRHHVLGQPHRYAARITEETPSVAGLADRFGEMGAWWAALVAGLDEPGLDRLITFEFVGGGAGAMTVGEVVRHLVNHATYHRGFVGTMLNEAGVDPRPTDLPVYIRDVVRRAGSRAA